MAKAKSKKITIEDALVPVDEQPYEVPENWCWTTLDHVCFFENGYAFKSDKFSDNGIPVIRISNIFDNEVSIEGCVYTTEENIDDKFIIKNGDLLIAMSGATTGKNGVFLSYQKAYLNQRVGNIKVINHNVLLEGFRNNYIASKQEEILRNAYGGAQPNISSTKIGKMLFPLPPLPEQQRIVEQIESLFSKLDEAKEKAQEAIDGFDDRRIMILRNAFEGLLTENWRKENGKSISEWERKRLSDCASAIGDGLHGTPVYSESGEYYFINGNNLEYDHIEYKSDTKTVNKAEYDKYYIELDDTTVFVSINGTLGKTAFYNNEPVILGKSACYVNTVETLDKYYLRYFFNTKEFIDYANEKATGSTIKNLGLKAIRMLEINVPSLDEQKEIVRLLDDLLVKEREAREATEVVIANIELMKKSVLAKAFRGELGTNDPSEESSIELLKQIIVNE